LKVTTVRKKEKRKERKKELKKENFETKVGR